MNNDNEIIKEFNDTFGEKKETPVEPYHATQNQNMSMSSEIKESINQNTTTNNSQNITMPNFINQNSSVNIIPEINNTVIVDNGNNTNSNDKEDVSNKVDVENNNQQLYNTTNYINDADKPTEKKKKTATIKINPELKTAVLLMLILLVAMSFIPTIFDLYDSLKIKIFG